MSVVARCLALLVALSSPLAAQHVQLSGWVLPEGSRVCGAGPFISKMKAMREDWASPATVSNEGEGTGCFEALSVSGRRLLKASEVLTKFGGYWVHREGGELVRSDSSSWPLLNQTILFERRAGVWTPRLLDSGATEQMRSMIEGRPFELDDAFFPSDSVEVGQSWAVPAAVLDGVYERRYPNSQKVMSMRLDSLGMWDGEPVAFVSYSLEIVRSKPSLSHHAKGRMVRSLATLVNVYEMAERTEKIEYVATLAGGRKVEGKSATTFWYEVRRRVTLPLDPASTP